MPQLGESVVEGTIGKWLVSEGQAVQKDQPVVEILTDKADSEVNSPETGVVTKIVAQEGAVVTVGAALCEVDAGAGAVSTKPAPKASAVTPSAQAQAAAAAPAAAVSPSKNG